MYVALAALIVQQGQGYMWIIGKYVVCDSSEEETPLLSLARRPGSPLVVIKNADRQPCSGDARPLTPLPWRAREPSIAFFAPCVDGSPRPPKDAVLEREIGYRDGIVSDFSTEKSYLCLSPR